MTLRFFYDIPVYRLPEERYYRERDEYIDSIVFPKSSPFSDSMRAKQAADPNHYIAIRDHLQRSYGGCWLFNEIIGYIRLHFLGSQVRGEYFGVKKKRIVRTRTKTLEYISWKLVPEINIPHPYTNEGIYGAVLEYLAACRKEFPGRHVDTERFEVIGRHLDWRSLMESNDAQPSFHLTLRDEAAQRR